jgi:hypothetical protein
MKHQEEKKSINVPVKKENDANPKYKLNNYKYYFLTYSS